ncbi:TlpA family protein disulfide reductase, partial [Armatimonas sp.]|uniref:TlpA family protein disulfide reductase n=1 Tax=Armatimonas sp. TaxID=1872638 RepID=UPI00286A16B8
MQTLRSLSLTAAATALFCTAALAQTPSLTIGDPTPAFAPEGWAKGKPTQAFQKGKVYVVEFWATWCGPCIASFPHLSDMADKMAGKATFISVNTWDRNQPGEKEAKHAGHVERVAKFIKDNDTKMRYTIALDDEKDTIATTWMRAAGRNGIPCAFIVNQQGKVAWIGHPMQMDKPLEEITAGTWDVAAAKAKYDAEAAATKAQAAAQQKAQLAVVEAAKAGDMAAFDSAIVGLSPNASRALTMGISMAVRPNAAFALKVVEAKMHSADGVGPEDWCNTLLTIARSSKDAAVQQKAADMSAECVGKADPKTLCLAATYHAQILAAQGKKTEALEFIVKAKA